MSSTIPSASEPTSTSSPIQPIIGRLEEISEISGRGARGSGAPDWVRSIAGVTITLFLGDVSAVELRQNDNKKEQTTTTTTNKTNEKTRRKTASSPPSCR